jgi:hypothetical protein
MNLVVMDGFVFGTDAVRELLIPYHVMGTALAHFVLSVVLRGAPRTSSAYFIYFVVIFIFISIAAAAVVLLLMRRLKDYN